LGRLGFGASAGLRSRCAVVSDGEVQFHVRRIEGEVVQIGTDELGRDLDTFEAVDGHLAIGRHLLECAAHPVDDGRGVTWPYSSHVTILTQGGLAAWRASIPRRAAIGRSSLAIPASRSERAGRCRRMLP